MHSKIKLGLLLILICFTGSVSSAGTTSPTAGALSAQQILTLVNEDRRDIGLPSLQLDPTLNEAALAKAQDMVAHDYFDHVSPYGKKPWEFFKALGYDYIYAGENLALNYTDAQDLESSWMNSPKHRQNILSPYYSDLGLAVVQHNQKIVIVQFFGSKNSSLTLNK